MLKGCKICSYVIIKTPERRQLHHSAVCIIVFAFNVKSFVTDFVFLFFIFYHAWGQTGDSWCFIVTHYAGNHLRTNSVRLTKMCLRYVALWIINRDACCRVLELIRGNQHSRHSKKNKKQPKTRKEDGKRQNIRCLKEMKMELISK